MLLMAACSSAEKAKPDLQVRTVYVSPDLPPIAAAADPRLSEPPRDRDMTQAEATDNWNSDRSGLKACLVQKHAALKALRGMSP
jgi:hypothetical protein